MAFEELIEVETNEIEKAECEGGTTKVKAIEQPVMNNMSSSWG